MDKTLEDACRWRGILNGITTEMAQMHAERAVEIAIRRAAEVCATQEVFTGPKACAAAILKLLD
jgi:hypothetical protein